MSPTSRRTQLGGTRAGRTRPSGSIVLVVAVLFALVVSGCGGQSHSTPGSSPAQPATGATVLSPIKAAPPLKLPNYLGDPVNLADYRGKAALVTFLYTHCIDVCPLIVADLDTALNDLGATANRVQVIAVSVDPRGDTRTTVAAFLKLHQMTGRMKYLIGTAGRLAPVWHAWHVSSVRDPANPKLVVHSSPIFGVSATGKLVTIYDSTTQPAQIAHDIPKLLAS